MKEIFTETNLSCYEDFHDSEWVKDVIRLVKGTEIEYIAEEFVAHWWGSSRAFILPWLLVNGVYDGVNSLVPVPISRQELWNEYLSSYAFHGALWKLSENMFCSIYYAYENLVVMLLQKIRDDQIRVTNRSFNKALIEAYGDKTANRIWNDSFIAVSREIRNCIVHNGGKVSTKLLKMRPIPHIKDGEVMISASDTRNLYETLKPIVIYLLEESSILTQANPASS